MPPDFLLALRLTPSFIQAQLEFLLARDEVISSPEFGQNEPRPLQCIGWLHRRLGDTLKSRTCLKELLKSCLSGSHLAFDTVLRLVELASASRTSRPNLTGVLARNHFSRKPPSRGLKVCDR